MKTPREILLARHQAADARLDKIRRTTINRLTREKPDESCAVSSFFGIAQKLWRELILPWPRAWAGLAAIWVLIVALKINTHETALVVTKPVTVAPEVVAELRQQKALFGELAGLARLPSVEAPKTPVPRPRSARNRDLFHA